MAQEDEVSVRELRQNLSVYLRRVERGETLAVTRRGDRVAMLSPRPDRRKAVDWLVVERGATRPTADLLELGSPPPLEPGERPLSELLDEIREDRL